MRGYRFLPMAALLAALLAFSPEPAGAPPDSESAPATPYTTGQLLVASPEMPDPRFKETVIYMVRHDDEGAMGIVLNRVIGKRPVAELLEGFGLEDEEDAGGELPIHYGGPVQPFLGFILHSTDDAMDSDRVVNGTVAFTTDVEILRMIDAADGPEHVIFALGYAGWGPGQLESEIRRGSWFVSPADESIVFGEDHEAKWDRAIAKGGLNL